MPPPTYTPVTDNTLLPFGDTMLARGDNNVSRALDISPVFENGFLFGSQTFTELYAATNGGVSFGNGDRRPNPRWDNNVITPFATNLTTDRGAPSPGSGLFFDLNTDRDSVVVTWSQVNYFVDWVPPRETVTFQMELIDLGDGDAEIVFRYAGMDDQETVQLYGYGASYSVGAHATDAPRLFFNVSDGLPPSQLTTTDGNTGVAGVWQFRVIDGALQRDDMIGPAETGTAGNDVMTGSILASRLDGGDGDDTLTGGVSGDRLSGGNGNDSLNGGRGLDRLLGGSGDDTLFGSDGGDTLNGGDGNDDIRTGSGNDKAFGGPGNDLIVGSSIFSNYSWMRSQGDVLQGMQGDDTVTGSDGNDTIGGQDGADVLSGGRGSDLIGGGGGSDALAGEQGNDTLFGGDGDDFLFGGQGRDVATGGGGNDALAGHQGDDTLFGGDGDDFLFGGQGPDVATGGAGADRFFVSPMSGDRMHITDYDPTEGDVLVFDGDHASAADFGIRRTVLTDSAGARTVEAVEVVRFSDPTEPASGRVIFTFESVDFDHIVMRLPVTTGPAQADLTFDLLT